MQPEVVKRRPSLFLNLKKESPQFANMNEML